MELVTRRCITDKCSNTFRVSAGCIQLHCSNSHKNDDIDKAVGFKARKLVRLKRSQDEMRRDSFAAMTMKHSVVYRG